MYAGRVKTVRGGQPLGWNRVGGKTAITICKVEGCSYLTRSGVELTTVGSPRRLSTPSMRCSPRRRRTLISTVTINVSSVFSAEQVVAVGDDGNRVGGFSIDRRRVLVAAAGDDGCSIPTRVEDPVGSPFPRH